MVKQKKIDQYIELSIDNFLVWDNVLLKYENELSDEINQESKIKKPLFVETFSIFAEILKIFISISNINDEWSEPFYTYQFKGMNAEIQSKKLNVSFSFVLYENEFFIETFLPNPEDINKVSDNFWFNLLQIRSYGVLEFEENASKENYNNINIEKRFRSKSQVFRLIRNFIFLDLSEGMLNNIGTLKLKWHRQTSWKDLIMKGCHGFELLYKINKEIFSKNNIKRYEFYDGS